MSASSWLSCGGDHTGLHTVVWSMQTKLKGKLHEALGGCQLEDQLKQQL